MKASNAAFLVALAAALSVAFAVPASATNNQVDAGVDQAADWGDTVTLDGSWTFGTAANIAPASLTWTQAGSPRVTIDNPNSLVTTFSTDTQTIATETTLVFDLNAHFVGRSVPVNDRVEVTLRPMRGLDLNDDLTPALIAGLAEGTTLQLADRTYSFPGPNDTKLVLNKPMVLKGPATLTGDVSVVIDASDVTVKDLTMRDIPELSWRIGAAMRVNDHGYSFPPRENITIANNTIENTRDHGIMLWGPQGTEFRNIKISSNTLVDIGRNEPLPAPGDNSRNGLLKTAVFLHPATGARVEGIDITDNYIKNPSFAAINLNNGVLQDTHISGNTMENMLAFAIQKASRPERDYTDETIYIYDNVIRDANNSLVYPKVVNDGGSVAYDFAAGTRETVPEAAIIVWGADNRHIKIYDNVISESRNGLLLCQEGCGVHDEFIGQQAVPRFTVANEHIDHSIDVYNNRFISNTGYDVVNLSPAELVASLNYWGDSRGPYASLAGRVQNDVVYLPAYSDPQLSALRLISSDLSADPTQPACSVTGSSVSFDIATGGESAVVRQSVTNVGNQALQELQLRVNPWTDAAGNEYATLTTSVNVGGAFVELEPGEFVSLGSFLPASGTSSDLEFKVAHSGRVLPTGDDSLSQVITLFASCG